MAGWVVAVRLWLDLELEALELPCHLWLVGPVGPLAAVGQWSCPPPRCDLRWGEIKPPANDKVLAISDSA